MKQLFKSVLCAALSLLALSACNDDLQTLTDVSQPNFPNDPTACVLMADDFSWEEADTRTSLTVEDNVALFSWTTGDLVGILPDEGAQVYFAIPELVTPTAGEEDDEQTTEQRLNASFDGGAWALKGESNYAAYYPFVEDFHLAARLYLWITQDKYKSVMHRLPTLVRSTLWALALLLPTQAVAWLSTSTM